MRMTPLDIQSHRFGRRFSGFDREEVETFLRMVAEDYESLLRENQAQNDRVRRLEARVEELASQEQLLRETLLTAQSMSEQLRRSAEKESEVLVSEAEVRAEKILDASHRRATRLAEDIREMRSLRTRLAEALRASIETHLGLIESLEKDPEPDSLVTGLVEGKITYLANSQPGRTRSTSQREDSEKDARSDTGGGV